MEHAERRLKAILEKYGRVAVAFSGGIDSALLLKAAVDVLGVDNALAITALAPNFSQRETAEAREFAESLGVKHIFVDFDPLAVAEFADNTPERCYHCKKAIFTRLWDAAREAGFGVLADGANLDDVGDYRPGMRAVRELGASSPLLEADLGKQDIRDLARRKGLAFWDKPSMACLASRIPYGRPIDAAALKMVERSEEYLLGLGFRNVRVRHHGDLARIETAGGEMEKFLDLDLMRNVADRLREFGYRYVALDLMGYRTGSLNEALHNTRL